MSWRETANDFERELTAGLERLAPLPRRDTLQGTLRTVAETRQRSGWSVGVSRFGALIQWPRVVAVGAVAVAALVAGIAIGTSGIIPSGASPTPVVSASLAPSASEVAPAEWQEPSAYTFVVASTCGERSLLGTFRVWVEDGTSVDYEALDDQARLFVGEASVIPTLGEMLQRAAEAQQREDAEVAVTTDPSDGHPVSLRIDWQKSAIDDEECYAVTDFVPTIAWDEPAAYNFVYSNCGTGLLAGSGTYAVSVRDGAVIGVRDVWEATPPISPTGAMTLRHLLDRAGEARSTDGADAKVLTDPTDGHPTKIRIEWSGGTDDEECHTVTDYTPVVDGGGNSAFTDTFADWTRIDMPDPAESVYGGATPQGLTVIDGRYIAVGSVNASCCADGDPSENRGVLWTSTDGRRWEVDDSLPAFTHASLHDILLYHRQLLIVGTYAEPNPYEVPIGTPALWTSTDGVTWERVEGRVPSIVTVGPDGFVGAYTEEMRSTGDPVVSFARSTDGRAWTETSGGLPGTVEAMAVRSGGTVVAAGNAPAPDWPDGMSSENVVTYMWSPGSDWVTADPAIEHARINDLIVARGQFYATGYREEEIGSGSSARVESAPSVWGARIGVGWALVEIPLGGGENIQRLFDTGPGLVATGDTFPDGMANVMVWISTDEETWQRVPEQLAFSGYNNTIADIIQVYNGILAIGSRWDATTNHRVPMAWVSQR